MLLQHITSIEVAIHVAHHRIFSPGNVIAADRGMNFIHPTSGLGGNLPINSGATLTCDWNQKVCPGTPTFNPQGYKGRDMHGSPGIMYDDYNHPRYFLSIGSFGNLFLTRIEFTDDQKLMEFAVKKIRTRKGIKLAFRLMSEKQLHAEAEELCSELIIRYSSIYVPLDVDD